MDRCTWPDLRQDYNNFHRIDIHKQLLKSAFEAPGEGPECVLEVNHKAINVDPEEGTIQFEDGSQTSADIIVAADGIRVSSNTLGNMIVDADLILVSHKRTYGYYSQFHHVDIMLLSLHH